MRSWSKLRIFLFGALFVVLATLSYTIAWNPSIKKGAVRATLPTISLPQGVFSLITEPAQGMAPVLSLIKNSSKNIDLVMYELTDKEICDALISALHRGVNVRVLLNQGYYGKQELNSFLKTTSPINLAAYQYLQKGGVQVNWTPASFALTHQKTFIIDGDKALIMTFNLVPKYYATGRDFGILDLNPNDVTEIENTFNADWKNQKINASIADDLVWSPGSENDMLLIINSAQKTLDIYNEEMRDDNIISALLGAKKRGVAVSVVMTYNSTDKAAFSELSAAGIGLHLFHGEKGLYIHAKMIIADSNYAFLGSENFSFASLNANRELGIFLSDSNIISSLEKTFSADWQNAKAF